MITAIDTSVLLDLFIAGAPDQAESQHRFRAARDEGAVIICDIAYADLLSRLAQGPLAAMATSCQPDELTHGEIPAPRPPSALGWT